MTSNVQNHSKQPSLLITDCGLAQSNPPNRGQYQISHLCAHVIRQIQLVLVSIKLLIKLWLYRSKMQGLVNCGVIQYQVST